MPRLTGIIFTRSPSTRKTTSIGLGASPLFLPVLLDSLTAFVAADAEFVDGPAAVEFVPPPLPLLVLLVAANSFGLGNRVVMLWPGTLRTLVRERVSISAVTDMPGRKDSLSSIRILTWNLVASWEPPLLALAPPPDELAMSVTVPLNLRSRNASTSRFAF